MKQVALNEDINTMLNNIVERRKSRGELVINKKYVIAELVKAEMKKELKK